MQCTLEVNRNERVVPPAVALGRVAAVWEPGDFGNVASVWRAGNDVVLPHWGVYQSEHHIFVVL